MFRWLDARTLRSELCEMRALQILLLPPVRRSLPLLQQRHNIQGRRRQDAKHGATSAGAKGERRSGSSSVYDLDSYRDRCQMALSQVRNFKIGARGCGEHAPVRAECMLIPALAIVECVHSPMPTVRKAHTWTRMERSLTLNARMILY